jgi:hypothetical protein
VLAHETPEEELKDPTGQTAEEEEKTVAVEKIHRGYFTIMETN